MSVYAYKPFPMVIALSLKRDQPKGMHGGLKIHGMKLKLKLSPTNLDLLFQYKGNFRQKTAYMCVLPHIYAHCVSEFILRVKA